MNNACSQAVNARYTGIINVMEANLTALEVMDTNKYNIINICNDPKIKQNDAIKHYQLSV